MRSPYNSKIKIYLDGADRTSMVEMVNNPSIQGFTTNPSLMRKSGVTDYAGFCKEMLLKIREKPISFEVFADDFKEMERQALEIASWGKNVYVKIPVTNSLGQPSTNLVRKLSHQGIKLNVTALFTVTQVWEVCQAVKGGAPSVISVFAGRIADTGRDPIPLMQASAEICENAGKDVELLWASTRESLNIVQAEVSGCKIITSPLEMIKKMSKMLNQDLTELSLETVKMFKTDADSAGFSL